MNSQPAKVAIHGDTRMFDLPPIMDRETGQSAYIIGWYEHKNGNTYAVSLLNPKGKSAAFCIAHQRLFDIGKACPECAPQSNLQASVTTCNPA